MQSQPIEAQSPAAQEDVANLQDNMAQAREVLQQDILGREEIDLDELMVAAAEEAEEAEEAGEAAVKIKQALDIDGFVESTHLVPVELEGDVLVGILLDGSGSMGYDFSNLQTEHENGSSVTVKEGLVQQVGAGIEKIQTAVKKESSEEGGAAQKKPQFSFCMVKCSGNNDSVKVSKIIEQQLTQVHMNEHFGIAEWQTPTADSLKKMLLGVAKPWLEANPMGRFFMTLSTDGYPSIHSDGRRLSTAECFSDLIETLQSIKDQFTQAELDRISCALIGVGPAADAKTISMLKDFVGGEFIHIDTKRPSEANKMSYTDKPADIPEKIKNCAFKLFTQQKVALANKNLRVVTDYSKVPSDQPNANASIYIGEEEINGKRYAVYKTLLAYKGKLEDVIGEGAFRMDDPRVIYKKVALASADTVFRVAQRTRETIYKSNKPLDASKKVSEAEQAQQKEYVGCFKGFFEEKSKAYASEVADTALSKGQAAHQKYTAETFKHVAAQLNNVLSDAENQSSIEANTNDQTKAALMVMRDQSAEQAEKARRLAISAGKRSLGNLKRKRQKEEKKEENEKDTPSAEQNSLQTQLEQFGNAILDNEKLEACKTFLNGYYHKVKVRLNALTSPDVTDEKDEKNEVTSNPKQIIRLTKTLESIIEMQAWLSSVRSMKLEHRIDAAYVRASASMLRGSPIYAIEEVLGAREPGEVLNPWRSDFYMDPSVEISVKTVHAPLYLKPVNEHLKKNGRPQIPLDKEDEHEPPKGMRLSGIFLKQEFLLETLAQDLVEAEEAGEKQDALSSHKQMMALLHCVSSAANAHIFSPECESAQTSDSSVHKAWIPMNLFLGGLLDPEAEEKKSLDGFTYAENANRGVDAYGRFSNQTDKLLQGLSDQKSLHPEIHPEELAVLLISSRVLGYLISYQDGLPDNWRYRQTQKSAAREAIEPHATGQIDLPTLVKLSLMRMASSCATRRGHFSEALKEFKRELLELAPHEQTRRLFAFLLGSNTPEDNHLFFKLIATAAFAHQKMQTLTTLRKELGSAEAAEKSYDPTLDAEKVRQLMHSLQGSLSAMIFYLFNNILGIQGNILCALNGLFLAGMTGETEAPADSRVYYSTALASLLNAERQAKNAEAKKQAIANARADKDKKEEVLATFAQELRKQKAALDILSNQQKKAKIEEIFKACNQKKFPYSELEVAPIQDAATGNLMPQLREKQYAEDEDKPQVDVEVFNDAYTVVQALPESEHELKAWLKPLFLKQPMTPPAIIQKCCESFDIKGDQATTLEKALLKRLKECNVGVGKYMILLCSLVAFIEKKVTIGPDVSARHHGEVTFSAIDGLLTGKNRSDKTGRKAARKALMLDRKSEARQLAITGTQEEAYDKLIDFFKKSATILAHFYKPEEPPGGFGDTSSIQRRIFLNEIYRLLSATAERDEEVFVKLLAQCECSLDIPNTFFNDFFGQASNREYFSGLLRNRKEQIKTEAAEIGKKIEEEAKRMSPESQVPVSAPAEPSAVQGNNGNTLTLSMVSASTPTASDPTVKKEIFGSSVSSSSSSSSSSISSSTPPHFSSSSMSSPIPSAAALERSSTGEEKQANNEFEDVRKVFPADNRMPSVPRAANWRELPSVASVLKAKTVSTVNKKELRPRAGEASISLPVSAPPPVGVSALLTEADSFFAQAQFKKAASSYRTVLKSEGVSKKQNSHAELGYATSLYNTVTQTLATMPLAEAFTSLDEKDDGSGEICEVLARALSYCTEPLSLHVPLLHLVTIKKQVSQLQDDMKQEAFQRVETEYELILQSDSKNIKAKFGLALLWFDWHQQLTPSDDEANTRLSRSEKVLTTLLNSKKYLLNDLQTAVTYHLLGDIQRLKVVQPDVGRRWASSFLFRSSEHDSQAFYQKALASYKLVLSFAERGVFPMSEWQRDAVQIACYQLNQKGIKNNLYPLGIEQKPIAASAILVSLIAAGVFPQKYRERPSQLFAAGVVHRGSAATQPTPASASAAPIPPGTLRARLALYTAAQTNQRNNHRVTQQTQQRH